MKANESFFRAVKEGIKANGEALSFGDFTAKDKIKAKIDVFGDEYAVKTYCEATRLEKNGNLLIESVPGASFFDFKQDERVTSFTAFGKEDAQITLGLEGGCEYRLIVDDENIGKIKANVAGKATFSVDFGGEGRKIRVETLAKPK